MLPDEENVRSRNEVINSRISSASTRNGNVSMDNYTPSRQTDVDTIKHTSSSTPSTPSWANLSPSGSDDESNNFSQHNIRDDDDDEFPGFLQSRDHGFPQVGDVFDGPRIDVLESHIEVKRRMILYFIIAN